MSAINSSIQPHSNIFLLENKNDSLKKDKKHLKGRKLITWEHNSAAAYVPTSLLAINNSSQKAQFIHNHPPVNLLLKSQLIDLRLIPDLLFLKKFTNDIENHCETRLQLFFQQALLVYKTASIYIIHHTCMQIGTGACPPNVKESPQLFSEESCLAALPRAKRSQYQAAHSSTLTNLKYQTDRTTTALIFAQDTYFMDTWNITVLLPDVVNKIDTFLEGKNQFNNNGTEKMRSHAIKILNQAALNNSQVDPKAALSAFISAFQATLQIAKQKFNNSMHQHVLQSYENVAKSYHNQLQDPLSNPSFILKLAFRLKDYDLDQLKLNDDFYIKDVQKAMSYSLTGNNYSNPLSPMIAATALSKLTPSAPQKNKRQIQKRQPPLAEKTAKPVHRKLFDDSTQPTSTSDTALTSAVVHKLSDIH